MKPAASLARLNLNLSGEDGTRTRNLVLAKHLRYQLRHNPIDWRLLGRYKIINRQNYHALNVP